jgi:hypothetical protein
MFSTKKLIPKRFQLKKRDLKTIRLLLQNAQNKMYFAYLFQSQLFEILENSIWTAQFSGFVKYINIGQRSV